MYICSFYTHNTHVWGGHPQIGIVFWRAGALQCRLPWAGECSRSASVSVHQTCRERIHSTSVGFFKASFNAFAHFMMGYLWAPAHSTLTVQQFWPSFWPKMAWPSCSTLPPRATCFCFPRWKKSSKGNVFANVKEVKQKTAEALNRVQKLFWAVEKRLDRRIASDGEHSEGDWSLNL